MSGILNSGKLGTLLTRLSSARAGYLDNLTNLDSLISTLLADGGYSSARAAKLDNLDQLVSASGASAPTELKGVFTANADLTTFSSANKLSDYVPETTASTATPGVWKTILTETSASGVIEFLVAYQVANTSSLDTQLRLSVDGTAVYTSATNLWTLAGENNEGVAVVGLGAAGTGTITFTDSFVLDFKTTGAGTVEIGTRCRYHLT